MTKHGQTSRTVDILIRNKVGEYIPYQNNRFNNLSCRSKGTDIFVCLCTVFQHISGWSQRRSKLKTCLLVLFFKTDQFPFKEIYSISAYSV